MPALATESRRRATNSGCLFLLIIQRDPVNSKYSTVPTDTQDLQCLSLADRTFLSCCLFLVLGLSLPGAADAQAIDLAQAAYNEGRFTDAARAGEALGTSEGYALAAESLTVHAHYIAQDSEKEALIKYAVELARKAVHSNPDNADAHLQLAHAVGRYAQIVSPLQAASRGYAEQVHVSTENALQLDPEMVSAHLSLGRWHAELVSAMGPLMARMIYRARKKDAIAAFERALELAPHEKSVSLEYALGLLALDEEATAPRRAIC